MFPLKDDIPPARFPIVTVALIALCVVGFVAVRGGCDVLGYAVIPAQLTDGADERPCAGAPAWLTPLTALFVHDGPIHLIGNMLFLWIFGRTVEGALGSARFLLLYLASGLAATALLVVVAPDSQVPAIGAAGAIGGVLGAYLMLFPRARVISLVFLVFFATIVAVPALAFLGLWLVEQLAFELLDVTSAGANGGAGYVTVLAGLALGAAAMRLLGRQRVPVT